MENADAKDVDAEDDYFQMTFLAVKMIHVQEYDSDEYLLKADSDTLYKKAKQFKIPFYRWYEWVESQFEALRTGIEESQLGEINFESEGPKRDGSISSRDKGYYKEKLSIKFAQINLDDNPETEIDH